MQAIDQILIIVLALLACQVATPAQGAPKSTAMKKTHTLYHESLRPQFHFTAAKNWINDPNGLVYYHGVYHLFFQYNPEGLESANKSWGHATSPDLVHWTQRKTALYPDNLGEIWSGSAVVDVNNTAGFQQGEEKPIVLIYTAAGGIGSQRAAHEVSGQETPEFTQCLAYSTDGGQTWTKYAHNPVLPHVRGENRDPKVIWYAPTKQWIMALYLDGNDFAFFSSPDLKSWTHLQTITVPGSSECPDFFQMPIENEPGKTAWVWTSANAKYLVGTFDGHRFAPDHGFTPLQNEFGHNFYAAQTYSNAPDGRRIQIAWMRDGQYPGMPFNQQLSFPTELTLHATADGLRLYRLPIPEIQTLHGRASHLANLNIANSEKDFENLHGDLLDINATIEIATASQTGLRVAGEPIVFDVGKNTLSCLGATAPLVPVDGQITLRVLVDRTTIEIFANGGAISLSSCFIPAPDAEFQSASFFSAGGAAKIISATGFELKSAWTNSSETANPMKDTR